MNFIITSFMYPLDKNNRPHFLGKLYFDNPRTKDEVSFVAQQLKKINLSEGSSFADKPGLVPDDCITLMTIYDYFYKNNITDHIVQQFHSQNGNTKNIYNKLAKMWIIVRSEEVIDEEDANGGYAIYRDVEDETKLRIINNYQKSIIECNKDKIADYFAFVSLLLGSGYLSNCLLSDNPYHPELTMKNIFIIALVMSMVKPTKGNKDIASIPYGIFKFIEPEILSLSNKIGNRYKDKRFLFICKKVHRMFDLYNDNQEMAFVELISVIELLITHNPDSMRYNVEESINKQFVGKLALILYENDKSIDLSHLKKELSFAYSIRSAIAHGDFNNLEAQLNKLFAFYNFKRNEKGIDYKDNGDALAKILDNAFSWLKTVIKFYLNDENRLDLIKAI